MGRLRGSAERTILSAMLKRRVRNRYQTDPALAEPAPHMTDDDNEDRHGRADHRTRFVHAPIIALAALR